MAMMEGWEIFTRNRGEARDGRAVGFAMRDDKYLKSLDIVERGVLTPLFYEDPSILPIPPFSNVVHPSSTSISSSTPTSTILSVVMFFS